MSKQLKKWKVESEKIPTREANFDTISGKKLDLCYFPKNIEQDYVDKLGFPGQYPYTRGVHHNLYRGKLWTMRQFAGYGTPEETNRRFKSLLKNGQYYLLQAGQNLPKSQLLKHLELKLG